MNTEFDQTYSTKKDVYISKCVKTNTIYYLKERKEEHILKVIIGKCGDGGFHFAFCSNEVKYFLVNKIFVPCVYILYCLFALKITGSKDDLKDYA